MRRGFSASILLHLGAVLLVLLAEWLAPRAHQVEMGVSQVALISGAEFDAAISRAPEGPSDPAPQSTAPAAEAVSPERPAEPSAPPAPESAPPPRPAPRVERPRPADQTPDKPAELAALPDPARPAPPDAAPSPAPAAPSRPPAPETPRQQTAPQPQAAPNASTAPPAPAPDADQAAPQAPLRRDVADSPAPAEAAPPAPPVRTSVAPRMRPAAPPPPPSPAPQETADAVQAALAALAAQEQPDSTTAQAAQPTPKPQSRPAQQSGGGRPLSSATRRGLVSGIERYFSYTVGAVAARPVRFKLKLTPEGGIAQHEIVQPSGNRGLDIAALRALYDADAAGVFSPLRRGAYNGWPVVLVAFTPEGIVFQ